MSRWSDQLKAHPIHGHIAQLRAALDREPSDATGVEVSERIRFQEIISLLESALKGVRPELLPFNHVDFISDHFAQHVGPQAEQYKVSGDVSAIAAANDRLSAVLSRIQRLSAFSRTVLLSPPIENLSKEVEAIAASFAKKREAAENVLARVKEKSESVEKSFDQLASLIDTRRQETDQRIAEWQQQFSQSQESRNQDYANWQRNMANDASQTLKEVFDKITL